MHNVHLSAPTIGRRSGKVKLKARRPRRKPYLSKINWRKRLTSEECAKVVWSDETNVQLFSPPGTAYIRRRGVSNIIQNVFFPQ
ncbi:hypothetical protein QE152_g26723 [Popillia japonica]|uniref:Uncharacterized protein n=1 Tax=Popillia japonica TaxID=7064 RepID=A0AAW1JXM1_POPJA